MSNYYNSTIQKKTGKCLDCGNETFLTAGRCSTHYSIYRKKLMLEKQKEKNKIRSLKSLPVNKEMAVKNGKAVDVEQELWYKMVANEIRKNPYCWETGEYISESDYRNASAHIFPKSIFKSVSTHPMNFLILSPRNGSHDKTHRLDTFSKMKVFKIAVERFKIFEPLITEKHKYLNTFKEYAEKYYSLFDKKLN